MIFFDNCCSNFRSKQYLSFFRQLVCCFRPPTTIRLLALLICLSFSVAAKAAQITLNLKAVPLATAFNEIKKQTGYGFWYEKKDLADLPKITVSVKNADVVEVMDACLKGLPLSYQIFDKTVVVKRKPAAPVKTSNGQLDFKVRGKVTDENAKPMPGVTVRLLATNQMTITDNDGNFEIAVPDEQAVLQLSYLGYATIERQVGKERSLSFVLKETENSLNSVQVVSTGYQTLPKERATGSFVLIDSALLNRSVGSNILDRLDGVTSSLSFNKNTGGGEGFNSSAISIRGRSTILGDAEPLIVLDNFAFTGDINAINPNDVESITILKDAAAASIWGTKAGNGVIVITTKSGRFNQKTTINFQSNIQSGERPDLYSRPQLSSREYIEVERYLFAQGRYNAVINNGYGALSPAIELMLRHRNGAIDEMALQRSLDSLGGFDIREQQLAHYYRAPLLQQYQLAMSGGAEQYKYAISGGFDRNLNQIATDSYSRATLNFNHTYHLLNKRLELNSIAQYSAERDIGRNMLLSPRYPYENWIDGDGTHLSVTDGVLRLSYAGSQAQKGLLDWMYRPLDENRSVSLLDRQNLRLSANANYRLSSIFKLATFYTQQRSTSNTAINYPENAYYVRNMINSFSSVITAGGVVTRPIPLGGILDQARSTTVQHAGRVQLLADKRWHDMHSISGVAGIEISEITSDGQLAVQYGYNGETGTTGNQAIDFSRDYPVYYSGSTARISNGTAINGTIDRFRSYFGNFTYALKDRYTASASVRKDESNLFGVKSNQKGVPLWSAGLGWEISREPFLKTDLVSLLKLRLTYGVSGNVDKSTSAYLTASQQNARNRWNAVQSNITNPPNPSLSWEKVANLNLGIDFALWDRRVSGSFELYRKKGMDLIGTSPIAPQTGLVEFRGNSAELVTRGIDMVLHTRNLQGSFSWNSTILLNMVNDRVSQFMANPGSNFDLVYGNYNNPQVGFPYNALYSFRWGGLDNTGAPRGYLLDQLSTDYNAIRNSMQRDDVVFHGSRSPTVFGSFIHQFSWQGISLSFNMTYKLGYFLRRESLDNVTLFNGGYMMPDYAARWQAPGDENKTNVPALVYPANNARQSIYSFGESLTYRGDHVRIRDVRVDYNLGRVLKTKAIKSLSVNFYVNNPGLLWRENDLVIDPDSPTIRQATSYAFGIKSSF